MKMYTRLFAVGLTFAAANAPADVYRCTTATGDIAYQDVPCHADASELRIEGLEELALTAEQSAAIKEEADRLRLKDRELADRLARESDSRRQAAARQPPAYQDGSRYSPPPPATVTEVIPYPAYNSGVWRAGVYYPPQYGAPSFPLRHYRYPDRWPQQAQPHDNHPRSPNRATHSFGNRNTNSSGAVRSHSGFGSVVVDTEVSGAP